LVARLVYGSSLLAAAVLGVASAAEAELRLVATEIEVGQSTPLRVIVRGQRPTAPPRLRVEPDTGVDLRFEQQSNQVTIVQGRVSESTEFIYRLSAIEPGSYLIRPARVEIGTRRIETDKVNLIVTERSDERSQGLTAFAGFPVERAYVGQVVVYRRGLRSSLPIDRDQWTAPPLEGLLPPRDTQPTYAEYTLTSDQGSVFVKEEFHPKILVAPGKRELPSAAVRVAVRTGGVGGGPFSRARTRAEVAAVPASTLTVEPLPAGPAGFSGLVGRFSFQVDVDRDRASVGDSVNLVVRIVGDGTLEGFALPRFPDSLPARVYDGSPATSARVDSSGYRTEGSFSRVIVPTKVGELALPPLEIVTFDPYDGRYVTHRLDLPVLPIVAGRGQTDGEALSFLHTDVVDDTPLAPDFEGVRDIRRSGLSDAPWLGSLVPYFLGVAGLPLIALLLAELGRVAQWAFVLARRRLARRASREVSPSQRLASLPATPLERLVAVDGALRQAVAGAVGVPLSELDREAALAQIGGELAEMARDLWRSLDRARFGGAEPPADLPTRARDVVRALEAAARSRGRP